MDFSDPEQATEPMCIGVMGCAGSKYPPRVAFYSPDKSIVTSLYRSREHAMCTLSYVIYATIMMIPMYAYQLLY